MFIRLIHFLLLIRDSRVWPRSKNALRGTHLYSAPILPGWHYDDGHVMFQCEVSVQFRDDFISQSLAATGWIKLDKGPKLHRGGALELQLN